MRLPDNLIIATIQPMQKLLLIDGNAILHRAYHAYPDLTNGEGQPVNAVYGFFTMLLNVIHEQNPTHLVVCFDRSKPTIRQSMYAGYHAHRPQMADGLASQIALIDELLNRMGAHIAALDGYEGDDLIGTIATHAVAEHKDMEVVIVTGDRDMLQLVNSHARVLMPVVGITKTVLFDEAKVEEKYGVKPAQFIDYKALIGDASDGYPGVTGIGPKTAAQLLQKYETFENLYQHVSELPEKQALMLATDAEQAALAKKLATIITDAPYTIDLHTCQCADFDIASLRVGFEAHNFKSLIARLDTRYPQKIKKKKEKAENQMELL
jgi:DNA polymerase I